MKARILALLTSKTVYGALATSISWLVAQPTRGPVQYIQALAGFITALGVRDAINTNGTKSPTPPSQP